MTVSSESSSSVVASTNSIGVASTTLNYPVEQLGKLAVIYAQTLGGQIPGIGALRTVADVETAIFPGVAPAVLSVSPSSIPSNATVAVTVCLQDAINNPIKGQFIGFGFVSPPGPADVDGTPNSGTVLNPTGDGGCTVAQVTTSGVPPESDDFELNFFVGDALATVTITAGQPGIIQVIPTAVIGNTSGTEFVITLLSSSGQPISDVQIKVECTVNDGFINVIEQPGITDGSGQTTARIAATLNGGPNGAPIGSGSCVFSTATDSPSTTVTFQGIDLCTLGGSPPVPGCEDPTPRQLTVIVRPFNLTGGSVVSSPSGINCNATAPGVETCTANFDDGTAVTLIATPGDVADTTTYSNGCTNSGSPGESNPIVMDQDQVCVVTFTP